jgi:hypothetical protein
MRRLMRITPLLCCVGCTVLLGFFWRGTAQPGPSQSGPTTTQRPKKPADAEYQRQLAELPVVDFTEFDPVASTDPTRAAKNRRHNQDISTDGTRAPRLSEEMDGVGSLPMTHWSAEPAFPITSDVIVIGTIREAKAYLSEDRTDIYSEVSLPVEEILKADPQYRLKIHGTVTADRRGGAVRFPSGKIVRSAYWGRGIPSIGHRYLLFLKDAGDSGFSIVTGYELTGKGVIPLDGLPRSDDSVYRNYESLRNTSEASLLDAVRKAISENGSGMGGVQ